MPNCIDNCNIRPLAINSASRFQFSMFSCDLRTSYNNNWFSIVNETGLTKMFISL